MDMEATLTAPSGKSELCEIRDLPASLYDIKFSPWEEGVHTVSLKYKGLHISGKESGICKFQNAFQVSYTQRKKVSILPN